MATKHIHIHIHRGRVKDGLNFYGLNKPKQSVIYKGKMIGQMISNLKWYIEDNPGDKNKLGITHGFRSLEQAKAKVDQFLD